MLTDYKWQYYKYKRKYLNLKERLQVQAGGKIFQKRQILYIVATISQPKLKAITKEITDTILGNDNEPYRAPHITLFNLVINADNNDSSIFKMKDFYSKIRDIYAETIANDSDPLVLEAIPFPMDFSFVGFRPRHFIRNYEQMDPQKILDFREGILNLIKEKLGKPKIKDLIDLTGAKYHVYSFNGSELFAEYAYYDAWKPHINFLNEFDIEKHNPKLHSELSKYRSGTMKVNVLVDEIKNIPQEIYEVINMARQMRNLTYAIDHLLEKRFKT
jgi:hypothetical protein